MIPAYTYSIYNTTIQIVLMTICLLFPVWWICLFVRASAACDRFGIARGKIRMWLLQKCQRANSPSLVTARTYINNWDDILMSMHQVTKHTTTRWRLSLMLMTPCSLISLIQPQKRPHAVSIPLPTHTGSTDCVQELRYDILANSLGCSCILNQWA